MELQKNFRSQTGVGDMGWINSLFAVKKIKNLSSINH